MAVERITPQLVKKGKGKKRPGYRGPGGYQGGRGGSKASSGGSRGTSNTGGAGNQNTGNARDDYRANYSSRSIVKGGGTKKVCLPKAKIASMSSSERSKVVSAKRAAAAKGKYRRSSKSNVTGTSSGGSLKTWVKQDWRQVGNPSKKCGEK